VIDLGRPDGQPAERSGPVFIEFLEGIGAIRVHLGDEYNLWEIFESETEADFDTSLLQSAYFV
jgi:hypothetical protein